MMQQRVHQSIVGASLVRQLLKPPDGKNDLCLIQPGLGNRHKHCDFVAPLTTDGNPSEYAMVMGFG